MTEEEKDEILKTYMDSIMKNKPDHVLFLAVDGNKEDDNISVNCAIVGNNDCIKKALAKCMIHNRNFEKLIIQAHDLAITMKRKNAMTVNRQN